MALVATGFLTQEANLIDTTIVDSRNGFNELSLLEMLWTVQPFWSAEERFVFNCYKNWRKFSSASQGSCQLR